MSPALTLPTSWWISTPSHTSMAIFARYSCERCMGLRSWSAAIGFLFGRRQRDRDRPEDALAGLEVVADALPVLAPHEAVERGEGTDRHHNEVGGLPRAHPHLGQRPSLGFLLLELAAGEEERLQRFLFAVWAYQRHLRSSVPVMRGEDDALFTVLLYCHSLILSTRRSRGRLDSHKHRVATDGSARTICAARRA